MKTMVLVGGLGLAVAAFGESGLLGLMERVKNPLKLKLSRSKRMHSVWS